MSTQAQDFVHLGRYNWVKISQNNNPQYFWGILTHDLYWLIALASYEGWSPNATCLKVKHFPSKAGGIYSTWRRGRLKRKEKPHVCKTQGQAVMGKFWCDGGVPEEVQTVCLSWEESAAWPGVLQFRSCQVPKACGFSMQCMESPKWNHTGIPERQHPFTQYAPGVFSRPDPARACVISNVWQRSTHLRAFLLASGCTNRCWSCVHRLCATDLRRKYIHVLAVVKAENWGNKLASHFW